jgi:hypothetical protein
MGNPDPAHISTSYSERQNLNLRMQLRRFARLTNGLSKKVENHAAAFAIYSMYHNFVRIHQTLRVTPAMEAGATDHLWAIEEMLAVLDAKEKKNISNRPTTGATASLTLLRTSYRLKDYHLQA